MNCEKFKILISELPLTSLWESLPEDIKDHAGSCLVCGEELKSMLELGNSLNGLKAPDKGEEFWDDYLGTVMDRTVHSKNTTKWSLFPVFSRRFIIPVFAVASMLVVFLISDTIFNGSIEIDQDELYSTSLDFILEEHDQESSQYMFNQSSVYLADEILPDNWGNTGRKDIKN